MKKVLTVLLAAVMVFALAACGGGEDSSGGSGKVGALYIGNVNDGGFTQSMNEALEASAEANDLELLIKENLGENDAQAIRDAVTNFVDAPSATERSSTSWPIRETTTISRSCISQDLIRMRPILRTSSAPWRRPDISVVWQRRP